MMSGHGTNPIIKKIKIGRPEHSLTPIPYFRKHLNFNLTPPPPKPLFKVDVICVSPLNKPLIKQTCCFFN